MNIKKIKEIENKEPEEINKQELMKYYGYEGKIGYYKLAHKIFKNMVLQSLAERAFSPKLSVKFHRWKGVKIGKHVYIGPKTFIDILYPHLVTIEDYVSMGYSMVFAHSRSVEIMTTPRTAWLNVVHSNATVNFLLVLGLMGTAVGLYGKKKNWSNVKISIVVFIISMLTYAFLIIFRGYDPIW